MGVLYLYLFAFTPTQGVLLCHHSRFICVHLTKLGLTFKSLAVSLRTTRFNIQKFYMVLALC